MQKCGIFLYFFELKLSLNNIPQSFGKSVFKINFENIKCRYITRHDKTKKNTNKIKEFIYLEYLIKRKIKLCVNQNVLARFL